jgi:hypothetical protein
MVTESKREEKGRGDKDDLFLVEEYITNWLYFSYLEPMVVVNCPSICILQDLILIGPIASR